MIGGIIFSVGALGLISVAGLLMWEVRSGNRLFAGVRATCDTVVARVYRTLVFGEIPHTYRTSLVTYVRRGTHYLVIILISILRSVEQPLSRMSRRMRYSDRQRESGATRTPSSFLTDITPVQKKHSEKGEDSV